MRLSRKTLLAILRAAISLQHLPGTLRLRHGGSRMIKGELAAQPADGTRYERIDDWYAMDRFLEEDEIDLFGQYIEPISHDNGLYTQVACDSLVERDFVQDLETREDVKLFLKLPACSPCRRR